MGRLDFRTRVLGTFVALVAGALALGLVFQRQVLLDRLERRVDADLVQERDELAALATGTDPKTGEPFGGDVQAIFDTFLVRNVPVPGESFFTFLDGVPYVSTPAPARLDRDAVLVRRWSTLTAGRIEELATEAGPVRALAVPLVFEGRQGGVFVVAAFLRADRAEIDASVRVSAVGAAMVLLFATAVAWWVAGRLLRPVRQLTRAAESIDAADTTERIEVQGTDEIARLARRFNEMLDRVSASFAAQRAFVDDAGHELRTPITIVRGHLELMGDDPVERAETVALVTDELDRMARIVDDLLVLAKAEQPDFVRPRTVEVADLTVDLFAKARALGDRRWTLDACADGGARVDAQRITQAVLNLARNAVDHTDRDTEVGLGSRRDPDGLRLWVRDTGPGIAHDERDRIFERFARGRRGERPSEGAGLGLAIVRSIVDAHGGRLELDSEPGHGATFTIVLPDEPPPTPPTTTPADEDLP